MAEARRMGKSELFSHFAERFEVKRTQAREFFDELTALSEKELKRAGENCAAVLVLVSPNWASSRWCTVEFLLAEQLGKRIFPILIASTPFESSAQKRDRSGAPGNRHAMPTMAIGSPRSTRGAREAAAGAPCPAQYRASRVTSG